MKAFVYTILLALFVFSCNSTKTATENPAPKTISEEDTVRITNDELEYEIIIIEPGFNTWLQSVARPEGYYSQDFLENRNLQYVIAWNQRVMQPQQFNPDIYAMQIDYQNGIDYGYEVNYKLYNYFIYFQLKYKQQLAQFIPRI